MKLTIESHVLISEPLPRGNREPISVAIEGIRIYPIGETIPVILKGTGCVGLATIIGCDMTKLQTRVTFTHHQCDETTAKVLYNQYRNKISSDEYDDDNYDSGDDMVIPGLARGGSSRESSRRRPKPTKW